MTATIEAKSMSSLTALAADPPLDPRSIDRETYESLVLYIARVPGSRDVFLTPMKPREKVVTAEDVESSLYYLHVHVPEDGRLLPSAPKYREPQDIPISSPPPLRDGCPISVAPSIAARLRYETEWSSNAFRQQPPAMPLASSSNLTPDYDQRPVGFKCSDPRGSLTRKPVGCRTVGLAEQPNMWSKQNSDAGFYLNMPRVSQSAVPPYPLHDDIFVNENLRIPRPRNQQKSYPQDQGHVSHETVRLTSYQHPSLDGAAAHGNADIMHRRTLSAGSTGLSFTLIRRDPSSGEQWNVANIEEQCDYSPSQRRRGSKTSGQPIRIAIPIPGYTKFLGEYSSARPRLGPTSSDQDSFRDSIAPVSVEEVFQRELYMDESSFVKRLSGHEKAKSTENACLSTNYLPLDPFARRSSDYSVKAPSNLADPQNDAMTNGPRSSRSLKHSGYTFSSPWNGRCEFSAGVGQSLKCKHSLGPTYLSSENSLPSVVSELRFNLPGGGPLATGPATKLMGPNAIPKRPRFFGRSDASSSSLFALRRRSEPDVSSGCLDLSLGQELAGGGLTGKRAKLGKLIINREGLKMMDLLVAANLSLWWRAYEKG